MDEADRQAQLDEARAAMAAGDGNRAVAVLNALLSKAPETVDGLLLMAECAYRAQQITASRALLTNALALAPGRADIAFQLGCILNECNESEEACALFEQAVQADPTHYAAWMNLGNQYKVQNQLIKASQAYRTALDVDPTSPTLKTNLGAAYQAQGLHEDALPLLRDAAEETEDPIAASAYLMGLNYVGSDSVDAGTIAKAHIDWGRKFEAQITPLAPKQANMNTPIKIGFMSADIMNHPVGRFLEPLVDNISAHEMEAVLVKLNKDGDDLAQRLEGAAAIVLEGHGLSDEALAQQIHALNLDLLVDLSGHTAGARLGVLARQPARIQATWLGYPNTTGLSRVAYRFADPYADHGIDESYYSESQVPIKDGFLCYRPPLVLELVEPPRPHTRPITFGSFNNFTKLNKQVLSLWAALLHAAPKSQITIKAKGLKDTETRDRVRAFFKAKNIQPERVLLLPPTVSVGESFMLYAEIDIALDPFPYNGTTTTFDALWMGRPVIAMEGDSHVSRVSAAILTGMGCSEWVALDETEYIKKAITLADKVSSGLVTPASVRKQLQNSFWMDEEGFARRFCAAVSSILQ